MKDLLNMGPKRTPIPIPSLLYRTLSQKENKNS